MAALRLAVELNETGREVTDEDREVLRGYASWGAYGKLFDEASEEFAAERAELKQLLTKQEYNHARKTILTAFYTPPELISNLWSVLDSAGFQGGVVLEPGCGVGDVIAAAPDNAHVVGVELDPMSARIASALNPDAQIRRESFVDTDLADGTFTATVGNVPFLNTVPYDPDRNRTGQKLHNYFISKSVDLTAPGGYVAVITSRFTADAVGKAGVYGPREAITEHADFITGARLPRGAFSSHAGTDVMADLLVFRVRETGQEPTERTQEFLRTAPVDLDGETFRINSFFANNPDHVLGEHQVVSGRFGREYSVDKQGMTPEQLQERLHTVLTRDVERAVETGLGLTARAQLGENVDVAGLVEQATAEISDVAGTVRYRSIPKTNGWEYEFEQLLPDDDGKGLTWKTVKPTKAYQHDWAALIDLRGTTQALLGACSREDSEAIAALQKTLNEQYDAYVEQFGYINRHEVKPPKVPTEAQIAKRFSKEEANWRKDNAVGDRPFEGELPDDVREAILDEVSRPTYDLTPVRKHLEGALKRDPYFNAVRALEHYSEETGHAKKTALFTTNPLRSVPEYVEAETVQDALVIVENTGAPVTLEALSAVMPNSSENEIEQELVDSKLAFRDPLDAEQWITAPVYLSGAVRTKLEEAERLAQDNPAYQPNVDALREAQPKKITEGISMNLGATWIPEDVYRDFIVETLDMPPRVARTLSINHALDKWYISIEGGEYVGQERVDMEWGVRAANARGAGPFNFQSKDPLLQQLDHHGAASRGHSPTVFSGLDAVKAALNLAPPTVNYSKEAIERGRNGIHPEATAAAGRKVAKVQDYFKKWVTQDPERYMRLVDVYNARFNTIVAPQYDGSHRTFAGLSEQFEPYSYQRNAVERIVNEPSVLLNHVVGAGKTGTMIMGAMELKRLGKVNQPWMVVPNHLVEQIAREAQQWYPAANILSGADARDKSGRQMLLAQTVASDWDLVVVPESVFSRIGVSAEIQADYFETQLDEARADLEAVQNAEELVGKGRRSANQKELERRVGQIEDKLKKVQESIGSDQGITFNESGCDYIIADEAHGYKNLGRYSQVPDLACGDTQKATDMDMKLTWLRSVKAPGAAVVTFATGTPIANSISEMWAMQRYLRPDLMQEAKIEGINSWGANFTRATMQIGFTAGGRIVERQRVSQYENVGDLAVMVTPFMDVVSRDQIPAKLPTVRGGKNTVVTFDVNQEVKDCIRDLLWREEHISLQHARFDGPLKIVGDGRKATLDPRMANLEHTPGVGRVNAVVDKVVEEWENTRDNVYLTQDGEESPNKGGLQILFCDNGVPSKTNPNKFNMYDAIRDELVQRGMQRDRIRFIHEWEDNKLQLFDDCNNGHVDVLIGNTPKLGTGANIQSRAVALHHVDVPWRPADLSQQVGRIVRQGNQNDEVGIYNYVAEGTYDGYAWGVVERKSMFIEQFNKAERGLRSLEPLEEDETEAMAQNKAIATGNQDFVLQIQLKRELDALESAAQEHTARIHSNAEELKLSRQDLRMLESNQQRLEKLAGSTRRWVDQPIFKEGEKTPEVESRHWEFGNTTTANRSEAAHAMAESLMPFVQQRQTEYSTVGHIAGVPFKAKYSYQDNCIYVQDPTGRMPFSVDVDDLRPGLVDRQELEKKWPNILTRFENRVRSVDQRLGEITASIEKKSARIDELKNTVEGEFPQRKRLDQVNTEYRQVSDRLKKFSTSDEVKRQEKEYTKRMEAKGRPPGWSLELNPTRYMIQEGYPCHPDTVPIREPDPFEGFWNLDIDGTIVREENEPDTDMDDPNWRDPGLDWDDSGPDIDL
ncbi:DEAD/DEAH box helicase family protein [Corynebacterium auriscanis]|uniref:DEAD/DEAH box helicase family protein n=1 Tax=Corynebacterium auriscanis TaxID=99807 RepID=UPI003CF33ED1